MNEKIESSLVKAKEITGNVSSKVKIGLQSELAADAMTGVLSLVLGFAGKAIAKAIFGNKKKES